MARIAGRHGRIEMGAGSPLDIIGSVTNWTLNQARDYIDVTCFEDTNKVYVTGLGDISGTLAFVYNIDTGSPESGDTLPLFLAAENPDPVVIKLTPNSLDLTHYWTGPAYVDIASIVVDVKGAVTGTGNFKASGSWQRV